MLGRLSLSSLHSNVQHLATTLSGHSPSLVADALCNQQTHVSYSQHEQALSVSIGTSSSSFRRAVQLRGQAYISRGWAASHLQLSDGPALHACSSHDNLPLLDRVREQPRPANSAMLFMSSTETWKGLRHKTCSMRKLGIIMLIQVLGLHRNRSEHTTAHIHRLTRLALL